MPSRSDPQHASTGRCLSVPMLLAVRSRLRRRRFRRHQRRDVVGAEQRPVVTEFGFELVSPVVKGHYNNNDYRDNDLAVSGVRERTPVDRKTRGENASTSNTVRSRQYSIVAERRSSTSTSAAPAIAASANRGRRPPRLTALREPDRHLDEGRSERADDEAHEEGERRGPRPREGVLDGVSDGEDAEDAAGEEGDDRGDRFAERVRPVPERERDEPSTNRLTVPDMYSYWPSTTSSSEPETPGRIIALTATAPATKTTGSEVVRAVEAYPRRETRGGSPRPQPPSAGACRVRRRRAGPPRSPR